MFMPSKGLIIPLKEDGLLEAMGVNQGGSGKT